MDGKPNRRPSMELIYEIMKKLDSLVNKSPIEPIVQYTEEINTHNQNNLDSKKSASSLV